MQYLSLALERSLWKQGHGLVIGLDEVGRGPLAGPVVAGAVAVLNPKFRLGRMGRLVKDSKQVSALRRIEIVEYFQKQKDIAWGIGTVREAVIDDINILQATKLAMTRAIRSLEKKLKRKANYIVIDGTFSLNLTVPQRSVAKADEKVFSCALASIVAKVYRDSLMKQYDLKYPEYGFARHKGYGTAFHAKALLRYGPCPIHRKSFASVSFA
jgi:ribonuclease HII